MGIAKDVPHETYWLPASLTPSSAVEIPKQLLSVMDNAIDLTNTNETADLPMEGTYIYHERQAAALCGQHALNNLLQAAHFDPSTLAQHADALDQAELRFLAANTEGGVNNKDYIARCREGSGNVDDAGT